MRRSAGSLGEVIHPARLPVAALAVATVESHGRNDAHQPSSPPAYPSRSTRAPAGRDYARKSGRIQAHADPNRGTAAGRHLVFSGEFKKSFTTFQSLSPEPSMSLWPMPARLTRRAWPFM